MINQSNNIDSFPWVNYKIKVKVNSYLKVNGDKFHCELHVSCVALSKLC